MSEAANPEVEPTAEPPKKRKFPIGIVILAAVLVVGGFFGIRMYLYNSSHVTTDDATVAIDVVPVNSQIQGTIVDVPAKENRPVRKGDLLAVLDDRTIVADVDQAKANLAVAEAAARSAAADVGLTSQTGQAQVAEAESGVTAGGSDVGTAEANANKAQVGVATARATYSASLAQAKAADEAVRMQMADRDRLMRQLGSFRAAVTSAEAAVKVAQANLSNAQATAENAAREASRYQTLAAQGAVAASIAEQRQTAAANAQAAVEAATEQINAAQATLNQRRSDLSAAQQQIQWAGNAIASARANAKAAHESATAQSTRVAQARSDVAAAQQGISAARAHQAQAVGKLQEAKALPRRLTVGEAAHQQALAKVRQAQAALESAQINLARTRIRAAVDGMVTKKTAEVGQQVTPGQPLMSIIQAETPWIIANFKETQLADVKVGQEVEIEIDKVPGHTFKGHVDSIAPGTGATFALLPPDNATGNFTKVVQRVPVKIVFEPGQPLLDRLVAGASANVAIIVK